MAIYVVKNEHTLGYIQEGSKFMGVLHGSVLKGGHYWANGPVAFVVGDLRPATLADFQEYRVSPGPYFNELNNLEKWKAFKLTQIQVW